jgi:hypothetical protein
MNDNNELPETNNHICEAVGCHSRATNKVVVNAGPNETIFLFLCDNCKPKFCADQTDLGVPHS